MKTSHRLATLLTAFVSMGIVAGSAVGQSRPTTAAVATPKLGLWVLLDAKKGKENEVARFLLGGRSIVETEPGTTTWYAVRLTPTRFAIFDTFADEGGRDAHLSGKVAAALMAQAPDLLQSPPSIEKIDVLAVKLAVAK